MSYLTEDSNTESGKVCKEFSEFFNLTKVFVRAIRRIHHGVREEQEKISSLNLRKTIRQKILDRHDVAFRKLVVGLQDYSLNYLTMRTKYEEFFSNKSKYYGHNQAKIETIYRSLSTQRDIIFHGVLSIINTQLKFTSEHFKRGDTKLDGDSIFKVIETYNKYLIKVHKTPVFSSSLPEITNSSHHSSSPLPSNSSKTQAPPIRAKEPSRFRNPLNDQCLPDSVLPVSIKFKRLTASKILQVAGSARARHVTKCVSHLLLSNAKNPQEENGTRLPWKPLIYDLTGALPSVDIFEEAIATEEDEYKRNQRKLDLALKQEFGEDFPGTDYLHGSDYFTNLPPLDTKDLDELVNANSKLFDHFARKFLLTFGVLVGTMMKRNKTGKLKIVKAAKARLEGYFVEQMWGPGTESLEEIVLWLPPSQRPPPFPPPALLDQLQLFRFLKNFSQYCDKGVLPESCEASCESLVDECRHVAIMSFMDIQIVNGFGPYSRIHPGVSELPDGNFCTERGQDIVDVIEMLVWQINEIEKTEPEKETKDWPIAELIGFMLCLGAVLGCLLSCARLRASYLLHTWCTAPFFLVTQSDLPRIIDQLRKMKIEERDNLVKTDDMGRIQLVLYREKVVKMLESMVSSVRAYEQETVDDVSSVCRTVSLAQLQNSMPVPKVWRGIGRIPHEPQDYVYEYIGTVLEPVLEAVTRLGVALQKRAGSTILKVVCYAWLEHIRVQKIRFSLWGAQQLLKDFHALAEWLRNYDGLDPEARTQILAVDVLRECEGVARLLMRQPPLVVGYTSNNQVAPLAPISAGRKHDKEVKLSCEDDNIPAEMYVPNQQLWLSLRARSSSALCVRLATCCSWPY